MDRLIDQMRTSPKQTNCIRSTTPKTILRLHTVYTVWLSMMSWNAF